MTIFILKYYLYSKEILILLLKKVIIVNQHYLKYEVK